MKVSFLKLCQQDDSQDRPLCSRFNPAEYEHYNEKDFSSSLSLLPALCITLKYHTFPYKCSWKCFCCAEAHVAFNNFSFIP